MCGNGKTSDGEAGAGAGQTVVNSKIQIKILLLYIDWYYIYQNIYHYMKP